MGFQDLEDWWSFCSEVSRSADHTAPGCPTPPGGFPHSLWGQPHGLPRPFTAGGQEFSPTQLEIPGGLVS